MKPETKLCNKKMTFNECELTILRNAVDLAQEKIARRAIASPEIQEIITVVENFIKKKSLICYGGTALNNILPKEDQFYNKETEIPDYDFFSSNALVDAKQLADIYFKKGYKEVEAKAGQHHGTYKVFVNFLPIADITHVQPDLFNALKKEAIRVAGILYAPPNYLRMSMFLELSRPAGDTSRWEKVMKRLTLLNKHYPLSANQCATIDFQREMENDQKGDEIYETVKTTLINQGVVFFGGYAISMYLQYMPKKLQMKLEKIPDFDVLSNDPETTAEIVKERLIDVGETNTSILKHDPVGDVIPLHYEIKVGKDTIAFIYKPIGCHSYNSIKGRTGNDKINIATIDTMMSFYLAFLYADRPYYDKDRILCMSKFLFDVQQKNRLEQKGLLRRFSITCYGHQKTVEEMRSEKAIQFNSLAHKRGTKQYDEWFLSYRPSIKKNYSVKPRNKYYNNKKYMKRSHTAKNWGFL